MPRPRLEPWRRWLGPAALLALAPKCVLCVLTYAGLGAALGLGGPELCGAAPASSTPGVLPLLAAVAAGLCLHHFLNRSPRRKT